MSTNTESVATSLGNNIEKPSSDSGLFSNKNIIIIILLVLVIISLIGFNLLKIIGIFLSEIADPIFTSFRGLLSSIGFVTGGIINGSAELVADTAETGIDIAKGTTQSIGDLLINSGKSGIDPSRQIDLSDMIRVPNFNQPITTPQPVQSSESTVTAISAQKPKAGWCHIGDFSYSRGCVEIAEHEKCMSGQIFPSQAECMKPPK